MNEYRASKYSLGVVKQGFTAVNRSASEAGLHLGPGFSPVLFNTVIR